MTEQIQESESLNFYQVTLTGGFSPAIPTYASTSSYSPDPLVMVSATGSVDLYKNYLTLSGELDQIEQAWQVVKKIEDKDLAKETKNLLSSIQRTISRFHYYGHDLGYIPQLRAFTTEDNAVSFEWISNDYRLGFNVESNPNESGWYLITNKKIGEISAYGYISNIDLDKLLFWLLIFFLINS